MIRNIIFDLGGVIITLDPQEAIRRFRELGLHDAVKQLDSYTQTGIFGDLERGNISDETFRSERFPGMNAAMPGSAMNGKFPSGIWICSGNSGKKGIDSSFYRTPILI